MGGCKHGRSKGCSVKRGSHVQRGSAMIQVCLGYCHGWRPFLSKVLVPGVGPFGLLPVCSACLHFPDLDILSGSGDRGLYPLRTASQGACCWFVRVLPMGRSSLPTRTTKGQGCLQ